MKQGEVTDQRIVAAVRIVCVVALLVMLVLIVVRSLADPNADEPPFPNNPDSTGTTERVRR